MSPSLTEDAYCWRIALRTLYALPFTPFSAAYLVATLELLQALLTERHALMAYLAVNNPTTVYKVLSTKMTDPPEQGAPPPGMWQRVLVKIWHNSIP